MTKKAQATTQGPEEIKHVGETAVTILAYLEMGKHEEVEHLLATTDPRTLGLVINTWYQMCVAARTPTVTARTARQTMKYLLESTEEEEITVEDADAAVFTNRVLRRLSEADPRGYAEIWQLIINEGDNLPHAVTARMLGFTRGMLADPNGPDCE